MKIYIPISSKLDYFWMIVVIYQELFSLHYDYFKSNQLYLWLVFVDTGSHKDGWEQDMPCDMHERL